MTRRFPIALLLLVGLVTSACGVADALGGGEDRLTIYSGRGESLVGPLLEQFNDETGIPIDVRYGDSAELALLIAEEGEQTPADVFYSQSPGATGFLAGEDLLAPLPEELLERVEPRFRNDGGLWVGLTGRQRVLVYNADLVDESELPESVFDVIEEPYAGRVAVAPQNGSFQDFVTAMRQTEGDDRALEWLTGLTETGAPTYANNNAIVEAVSRGEVEMGLVNHYYNFRFLEEDPSLPSRNYIFPGKDIGALLIASTVSVTERSDHPDAPRLIEFLLSEQAQRYFAEETKEYPLAAGVEPADDVTPLDPDTVPAYDFDELGGGLEKTVELIRRSGLSG